ncbi:MAG: hypothetical protein JOZ72_09540 [Alphaproteobacteria bacterium]|nr:hypothetical protein [Alphaproteobacteria bacterium]
MAANSDKEKLDALRVIVTHYLLNGGSQHNRQFVATRQLGLESDKQLNNFLSGASARHAKSVKEGVKQIAANPAYYDGAPRYIREAIQLVYGFGRVPEIGRVFGEVADHGKEAVGKLSECYAGIWDVFRYAAHDSAPALETAPGVWDANIVRISLRIDPCEGDPPAFPNFEINYLPPRSRSVGDIKTTKGCVVPLKGGPFMGFFGVEENTLFPLEIRARRFQARQNSFIGLAKRHLDDGGAVIAARAIFVRSKATDLESLKPKLGLFSESKALKLWKDEVPDLAHYLSQTVNEVKYGGKSCLWL